MSNEIIFNIFSIFEDDICTKIGFRAHEMSGSDEEKIEFLQSRIAEDFTEMSYITIPNDFKVKLHDGSEINGLTNKRFNILMHNGTISILYEPIFQLHNASATPLFIATGVADGKIKIDMTIDGEPVIKAPFTTSLYEEVPRYYLTEFMRDEGFAMKELLDKDFFDAIRLLFINQHYVSCIKLLLSTIDSIAFLEYGDVPNKNIFKEWIKTYCNFSKLHITEDELWEYRNSMLHMTNAQSRKVVNNQIRALEFYVSDEDRPDFISDGKSSYFNLKTLISVIAEGTGNWAGSFNIDRDKFSVFCDRYDLIISDSRYGSLKT